MSIHSLSSKDQKWILKQLPKQQSLTIKAMIRELKALGIPGGQGWFPDLQKKNEQELLESKSDDKALNDIRVIEEASIDQIKKLLLAESNEYVAALLVVNHWSWESKLLSIFSRKRRTAVLELVERRQTRKMSEHSKSAMLKIVADSLSSKL